MDPFEEHIWTKYELQAIQKRKLRLISTHMNLQNTVQIYVDEANQDWVIKLVQEGASELNILRELLALPSAENHTIPAEIIPCGKTSLILMPCLHRVYHLPWGSLEELLCCAQQMLVGLRFMHGHCIAHFDIHAENVLYSLEVRHEYTPPRAQYKRCYFIDFGSSRRLQRPPNKTNGSVSVSFGAQGGHYVPPEGKERVNPYAYDIFCTGEVIFHICRSATYDAVRPPCIRVPPSVWAFCDILRMRSWQHRPTANTALSLLHMLKLWLRWTQWLYWFTPCQSADVINLSGWHVLTWLTYSAATRPKFSRNGKVHIPAR